MKQSLLSCPRIASVYRHEWELRQFPSFVGVLNNEEENRIGAANWVDMATTSTDVGVYWIL